MGEAKHNILTKFSQQQRINHHFQGEQVFDAVNINHFSESIEQEYQIEK
jgi:hypothetical protein